MVIANMETNVTSDMRMKFAWFLEYGRCKFTSFCKFKHTEKENFEDLFNKISENAKKLIEINKKLENIKKEESDICKKREEYQVKVEERFEKLETKLTTMMNLLQEKDAKIATLESSFEETKKILDKSLNDSKVGTSSKQKFKSDLCEFKLTSTNVLKTHIARKHTKYSEVWKQIKCEICEKVFSNEKELLDHMISHSFKDAEHLKFKCDECEFWGPNAHTMKMHFKRLHSDIISCGMCDFEAKDLETLDIPYIDM